MLLVESKPRALPKPHSAYLGDGINASYYGFFIKDFHGLL